MIDGACSLNSGVRRRRGAWCECVESAPSHDEQLTDHASALADVLLHQLRARDTNERALGVVGHSTREQSLAGAGRAVQNDTLGLSDTERLKQLGVLNRELNDLLDFTNLLVETTDHVVGRVGNLFDLHQTDEGVDFVGEDFVQGIAIVAECHASSGNNLSDIDSLVEVYDILALRMNLRRALDSSDTLVRRRVPSRES